MRQITKKQNTVNAVWRKLNCLDHLGANLDSIPDDLLNKLSLAVDKVFKEQEIEPLASTYCPPQCVLPGGDCSDEPGCP